jgi:hypothetical protein
MAEAEAEFEHQQFQRVDMDLNRMLHAIERAAAVCPSPKVLTMAALPFLVSTPQSMYLVVRMGKDRQ